MRTIYIYIYIFVTASHHIGLDTRSWHNLGSIPGRVIPKAQKMVLDGALHNTQHYQVRIKGKLEQSREWSRALPYTSAFGSPSTTVTNFTFGSLISIKSWIPGEGLKIPGEGLNTTVLKGMTTLVLVSTPLSTTSTTITPTVVTKP